MKKILLFIIMLLIPMSVFARAKTSCDYSLLSKLKKYASNINIIYDYKIADEKAVFTITIDNLVPDMYVLNETSSKKYNYADTNNGELVITDVKDVKKMVIKIMSNNSECPDQLLLTQYLNFPVYNKYSTDPLCEGLSNYSLCYTFLDTDITYEQFKERVTEYKNKKTTKEEVEENNKEKTNWDRFIEFMFKYGVYLVALFAVLVAYISIKINRKNKFDFKL